MNTENTAPTTEKITEMPRIIREKLAKQKKELENDWLLGRMSIYAYSHKVQEMCPITLRVKEAMTIHQRKELLANINSLEAYLGVLKDKLNE